ncbi:podocalyxin-like protein 2 [Sphaeramia orbicularis]|uniref:podocalyxin-like protein 2 n=1 Tax=Sphaeramia orbicularis TaxID=375764 RepID=UPI00117EE73C|nr:podocalyxin-like protein 2 [Sphaeramia orbicularis]
MLCTAADMKKKQGLVQMTLMMVLLTSCDAFRLSSSQRLIPLSPPVARFFQDQGPVQTRFIQELVRTKRHMAQELVRAQPLLVHDLGWPEIHETSRSQAKAESTNSSSQFPPDPAPQGGARPQVTLDDNLGVQDEMERMVHLAVPQDPEDLRGPADSSEPETQDASGFYGTDTEDRDRGEEGGEERERRGGDEEWDRDAAEEPIRGEGGGAHQHQGPIRGEGGGAHQHQGPVRGEGGGGAHQHRHSVDVNHTTPDLDALIGYSPSFPLSSAEQMDVSSPAELLDSGPQNHRSSPVLEVSPLDRELWDPEEVVQSSGYGGLHFSTTTATATSTSVRADENRGTATPETDTGTDFSLVGGYAKAADEKEEEETEREEEEEEEDTGLSHIGDIFGHNPTAAEVGLAPSREPLQPSVQEEEEEEEEEVFKDVGAEEEDDWRKTRSRIRPIVPLTTDPAPTVGFTHPSWDWLDRTTALQDLRSEVMGGGVTEVYGDFDEPEPSGQVVCIKWNELTGRGYVILNMTHNMNCEEFRVDRGFRLLRTMERVFARRMNSPEGSWVLYLSKPTHQQHQLLMNVASARGVIATKDVLGMLGEIRTSLNEVGIQNYSAASSCQTRPSQTRSDYGKLFVVLVIIGSVCTIIITSGFIYICWQRRLPATKTSFRAEELHFVENGCHDNPTLDVTNDNQPEMREKKPSANGLTGGGDGGGQENSRWQVFVNQAATEEEEEEQDTHL